MSPRNGIIIAVLVAAIAGVVMLKQRSVPPSSTPQTTALSTNTLPRLLELGSVTCIPCKEMAPIIDELRQTYAGRMKVEFIDVKEEPAVGELYDVEIIPTQIFFAADGKELFRHQGFFPKEDILAKWKELGIAL